MHVSNRLSGGLMFPWQSHLVPIRESEPSNCRSRTEQQSCSMLLLISDFPTDVTPMHESHLRFLRSLREPVSYSNTSWNGAADRETTFATESK